MFAQGTFKMLVLRARSLLEASYGSVDGGLIADDEVPPEFG